MRLNGKKCLVIGASSGMGEALAELLARRGAVVAAVARRRDALEAMAERARRNRRPGKILAYAHDVTATAEVPALFQRICADMGGLDMVFYCAGAMPKVAIDEYDFEKDRQMVEVNLLGAIAWLNEAAVRFERLGTGHIVGVGSIAGDRGRAGNPVYNASKAGLATYLAALNHRLTKKGVTVTTIKPGFVDTPMTKGLKMFWLISAKRAAELILEAAADGAAVRYVPRRWWLVGTIIRHIPNFIFWRFGPP